MGSREVLLCWAGLDYFISLLIESNIVVYSALAALSALSRVDSGPLLRLSFE